MAETVCTIDVRYPDTDAMGIVHHAVYPVWYEIARMDFFEKSGFGYAETKQHGIDPAMVNLNMNYRAPVRFPGRVEVHTQILTYAPRKLELGYTIYYNGIEAANARSFHVWTGPDMRAFNVMENLPELYAKIEKAGN